MSQTNSSMPRPLLITTGEPAGIGMDIVIDILCQWQCYPELLTYPLMIAADKTAFFERADKLQVTAQLPSINSINNISNINGLSGVNILDIPCNDKVMAGVLNVNHAKMVKAQLDVAHDLAVSGQVGAIITAPIQKSVMIEAGITLDNGDKFSGHTEYFMVKSGVDKVVMMLANAKMRVALVTTHLPLREVADAITADAVRQTVMITHQTLKQQFHIQTPNILVCGLNPHAGENGHLGTEEIEIINPVLSKLQSEGINISLALPADTLFTERYLNGADAIIAMYHDQGLAPLKSHGFGDTVNITLGLPYIRTSVDHGTALDLAGTGQANSQSLLQALRLAIFMSGNDSH